MIFVLFVFFSSFWLINSNKCECGRQKCCYSGNCAFYSGGEASCFCWINNDVKQANATSFDYLFFPSGDFSTGGCEWCGHYNSGVQRNGENIVYSFKESNKEKTESHFRSINPTSDPGPLLILYKRCMGDYPLCTMYIGSYQDCVNACQSYQNTTHMFIGDWKLTYWPSGSFSSGGCDCYGNADPCRVRD